VIPPCFMSSRVKASASPLSADPLMVHPLHPGVLPFVALLVDLLPYGDRLRGSFLRLVPLENLASE
jgi:hypothetical protein